MKYFITGVLILFFCIGCAPIIIYEEKNDFLPISDKMYTPVMEIYYQYPKYPAGCELAATCQTLRYYGCNTTIEDLLYIYLPVSNEEWIDSYYGDIYSGGFAFPKAITSAIQQYLEDMHFKLTAYDISKFSWDEYASYIKRNIPVITWYTIDYKNPRWSDSSMGGYHVWWNLHCITVYDIDDTNVYIADPIEGFMVQEISKFKSLWQECGSYAVVVIQ